jgi:hypothetical protein
VPRQPARTFPEAVQALWFAHLVNVWEDCINANSLGRLDQILYPYYEKDLKEGRITEEEAFEWICCLWLKLYRDYDVQQSCIGGVTPEGKSGVNALSFLKALLPFDEYRVLGVERQLCPESGLPIYVKADLQIDGVQASITVDWRKHDNPKSARIVAGGRSILVDHLARTLTDGEQVSHYATGERLLQHYLGFFTNADIRGVDENAERIHQILFEVKERL